ncbi:sensor domain-containing diguanylate cyclase [Pseudomarimonas salicorniae]|uniref:diguanylate cyclase n=1 Tax=Pseudomarimonas salicorniae TaxID=2933270 RepID=A0ABT0GDI9_9GAMM|nr:sensor domain-containing diguanylate cyclase [Lysobacter sp. CAU 1642]MCK7592598.1 diguanylate cyclase [Lysobacter sp. CAU 1642]
MLERVRSGTRGASLRRSLLLSYVALVVAMAVSLSWAVGDRVHRILTEWAGQRIAVQAMSLAQRLDDALAERLGDMRLLASLPVMARADADPVEMRAVFRQLGQEVPEYAWIARSDGEGRIIAASDPRLEGLSVAERPWFSEALQGPFLGDAHDSGPLSPTVTAPEGSRAPLFIDVAAPVLDAEGRAVGVLGAHLSLGWADALQERMGRQVLPLGDVEVLIINRAGAVLIGPPASQGRPMWELMSESRYLVGLAATAGHPTANGLGWSVLVRVPREQALSEIGPVRWAIAGVAGVIALLALAFASVMARLISGPLRRLSREAKQIIAGESRDFAVVRGYRESVELSMALHTLMESLGRRRAELEQAASSLERDVAERTAELEAANRRLAELAITDPLTRLYNRRHFDERLLLATGRCVEGHGATVLLLVDIDHFKRINDRHGHPVGDEVLRQMARLLGESVRPADMVARIGGEEFAVLAADTSAGEGLALAERLLQRIRQASPLAVGRMRVPVSVSIGIASCRNGAGRTPDQLAEWLLGRADSALYQAKAGGRDRLFEALPENKRAAP